MVAIVSSIRAGLELGSRELLGQGGVLGNPAHGRNGQGVYVNAANGQLVVQVQDELLVARGEDLPALRTYNSAGSENDDNGDGWTSGVLLLRLMGTVNTAGSRVSRTAADGSSATYDFDAARNLYVTTEGEGAHDTIDYLAASGQFEWRDGATGTLERFEGTGQYRLLRRRDVHGNELAYAYGSNGFLSSVTSASGDSIHYDYSGNNLAQIRTVTGGVVSNCVRYGYDANNRLASVTVDLSPADGSVTDGKTYETRYEYDGASKRLLKVIQSDGANRSFTWIDLGGGVHRLATMQDPLGRITRFAYGAGFATMTDPSGLVTRYEYDGGGRPTRVTPPLVAGSGASRQFAWDAQGNLLAIIDGEGRTTSYQYDAQGNQVLQRDAAGNTVTRTFNARNQLLTESVYTIPDPDGAGAGQPGGEVATRNVYDAGGRNLLRFVLTAEGRVTEHRFNGFGERVATIRYAGALYAGAALPADPAAAEAALVAWAASQDRTRTQRTDYAYDGRGQLQTRTGYAQVGTDGGGLVAGASVEQFVHDAAGRLLQVVSPNAGIAHYTHDGLGRMLTSTDAMGQTTVTHYDDANRRTSVTLANGLVTVDLHDAAGRLVSTTQHGSSAVLGETRYFYDAGNRLRMTQDPTGVRRWTIYDDAGRKTADIDGNGTMVEYTYDRRDLVVSVTTYGTAVNTSLLVDGAGKPITSVSAASVRPAASGADHTLWRQYDAAGRLVREASQTTGDSASVTEMRYDGASRLVQTIRYASVVSTVPAAAQVAPGLVALPPATAQDRSERNFHDAEGRLAGTLDAAGYLTVFRYTPAGQLGERIAYANATSEVLRAAGTLSQLVPAASASDVRELTVHDAQGRVMAVVDGENYLTETIRDAAGNVTQTIRYANRVSPGWSAGGVTPGSLAGMRPLASPGDRTTTRSYDALNRVVQETTPEGVVTQYGYDALGHLVSTHRAIGTGEVRTLLARYDVQGRLTGELSAEGAALLSGGQTQAQVDAIWAQYGSTHAYDAASRRIATTDALGQRTLFFYNADGAVTHTVNSLGEVQESRYDTRGRLIESIAYGTRIAAAGLTGGLAPASLDSALAAVANATLDSRTSVTYTRDGRAATAVDALGNVAASTFNAFGEEIGRQLSGASVHLIETYAVDRRGQRTGTVSDAGGLSVVTSVVYDAFGREVRSVDANGNLRERSHDRLGREVVTVDGTGALRTSSYDAFGQVLTQTDTLGRTTTYAYDPAGRTLTVTTPEGVTTVTTYTRHGQVQTLRDGNGNVTAYGYDRNGKLLQTTTPLTATSSSYDAAGRVVETTDADGNKVSFTYDAANRVLTRRVDGSGLNMVTRYEYDARGQRVRVTDPNGGITTIEYDRKGQVLKQTVDPAGLNLQNVYSYDARGNVLTVRSPAGSVTQYVYDSLGRRIQERVDPTGLNLQRSWTYDGNGNVASSTDGAGHTTRYAHDAEDRLVFTVDALGNVRQNGYDAEGRVVRTTAYVTPIALSGLSVPPTVAQVQARVLSEPGQDVVEHRVHDRDGRLTATVDGTGAVVRYVHDANGNVVTRVAHATRIDLSTWSPGTAPAPVSDAAQDDAKHVVYDALNRAVYTVDGVGAVVAQVYDGNGNVLNRTAYATTIDPATSRTQSAIASAVAAVADSQRDATTRSTYDRAGRLIWSVDGTGAVTRRSYDGNGNLVREVAHANAVAAGAAADSVLPSSADRITGMAYDAANRLLLTVDAVKAVREQVLDADGRVVAQIAYANPVPVLPALDAPGALAALRRAIVANAAADRTTRYAYDAAGRQVLTVDASGGATEINFDGNGHRVAQTAYATPVNLVGLGSAVPLETLKARLVAQDGADRVTRGTFDAAGRAVHEIDPTGAVKQYHYDAVGRVTRSTRYAAPLALPNSNAAMGLAAVAAALQPDAARDQTEVFSYNAASLLIATTDALGGTETYSHDALGRKRSFVNKKGYAWTYTYDAAGRMLGETSPQVQLTSTTLDGAGALSVSGPADAHVETRMAYDALGNLLERTEAAGRSEERTTRYGYDALGRQVRTVHAAVGVYDAAADVVTVNGATGVATRTERTESLSTQTFYDALGNAVANRDVGGAVSQKAYDLLGRVAYEIDALGYVTGYTRNAFGEVTSLVRYGAATMLANMVVTQSGQAATRAQVASALAAAGVDHSRDRALLSTYDRAGRLVEHVEPGVFVYDGTAPSGQQAGSVGKTTRNVYDAFGHVVQVQVLRNAANQWATTTHYFDRAGRETATVDALGYLTLREFDARGNLKSSTEYANAAPAGWTIAGHGMPSQSSQDRATAYTYDRLDRKTSETRRAVEFTDANGMATRGDLVTLYEYDAVGNQTRVTDPAGHATLSCYDALGRVTAVTGPSRSSTVSGTSVTPLTVFRRDAHGNVVATIEYARGAAPATGASEPVALPSADDRNTFAVYDRLGRTLQTTNAEGAVQRSSYDAHGHVRKSWQGVTGNDGITRTAYELHQYDKLGQRTSTARPASTSVYQEGSGIVLVSQAQAGNVVEATEYNAFGEVTRKAIPGEREEYFDYDNAGRLWRTNSGDGVDRIHLYDALGNVTAEIRSSGSGRVNQDIKTFANADAAAANPYVRRVDIQYDALGRVTARLEATREQTQGGVVVDRAYTTATITANAAETVDEDGLSVLGARNRVVLTWGSLGGLGGSGDIKVQIDYRTALKPHAVLVESGIWQSGPGTEIRSRTSGILSGELTGTTLEWEEIRGGESGVSEIRRIVVWKKDVDGEWRKLIDQMPGHGGNAIIVAAPADPSTSVQLLLRNAGQPGDTGWWTVPLVRFGAAYRVDASSLPAGNYDYRVVVMPPGEAARITAFGTTAVALPPLNSIGAGMEFRPMWPQGTLSWPRAGSDQVQTFRFRPQGSGSAWTALTVSSYMHLTTALDGVQLQGVGAGSYEFELLWARRGENVPHGHATGVFTVLAEHPAYWVDPVGAPPITGLRLGTANVGGTYSHEDESGNPFYYGGTEVRALVWNATNATVARYRVAGGSWVSLPINNDSQVAGESGFAGTQRAPLNNVPPGTYEVEILTGSPVTGRATGTVVIHPQGPGHYATVQVQVPSYVPQVAYYQPVYEWRWGTRTVAYWEWVSAGPPQPRFSHYDENGIVWARDEYGNIIYDFPGRYEQRYRTETYPYLVQVGQTPVYARDESGNIIYDTVWTTQTQQRWVPGTTPPPTLTVTTPPYTAGYWVPEVATRYMVSVTTAPGSSAVSTLEGSTATRNAVVDGDSRWLRPTVLQKTDRWGNVIEITDPRAAYWKTSYRYNASNQMVQQTLPDAGKGPAASTIHYDQLGRQVAVRDANGNVNRQVFDADGNLVREIHADGGFVSHAYDAFGERVRTTDALGQVTDFTYDRVGNLLRQTRGAVMVFGVGSSNDLTYQATRRLADNWTYDQLGRKLTHTNGNGEKLSYRYDVAGNVVETRQPLGQTLRAAFDAQGRKVAEIDANGHAATWEYDYFGQIEKHTDLGGTSYLYAYDSARQLIAQSNSRGQAITYTYDAAGQLATIRDAVHDKTTSYIYDLSGRKVRERVVQAGVTYQDNHLAYDARGNLRDVADGRAHVAIEYDNVGNRTRIASRVNYQGTGGETGETTDRYFVYDAMNRQIRVDAVNAAGDIGGQGHAITYDLNGNRTSDMSWGTRVATVGGETAIVGFNEDGSAVYATTPRTYAAQAGYTTETYRYDNLGRLQSVVKDGEQIDVRYYDGAGRVVQSGPAGALHPRYAELINQGVAPEEMNGKETRINRYDANGRLLHQRVLKSDNSRKVAISWDPNEGFQLGGSVAYANGHDQVGNVRGYVVQNHEAGLTNEFQITLERHEGYVAAATEGTSSRLQPGVSRQNYDVNGMLVEITDFTQPAHNRRFVNDANGRALFVNQAGNIQRQLIVNGEVLGRYGVGVDAANPASGYQNNPNFANIVDFHTGYAKVSAGYPSASPGAYTIRAGDTLKTIAQGAYGDSALWYRIAEANGLSSPNDLKVGQTLNIPSGVGTIHNNAGTFEPYDPSRIEGDTTPSLASQKPKKRSGFGQLLMLVVAIVVSAFTVGLGTMLLSSTSLATASLAQIMTVGIGAISGGGVGIGLAATAGAAGAAASQLVGMATGNVDKFDWKGVALSAVSAGVSARLGGAIAEAATRATDSVVLGVAAASAATNAITQGVGVITGLQPRFDWRGVAASAAGSVVGYSVGQSLGLYDQRANSLTYGQRFGGMMLASFAGGVTAAAARGGKVSVQQVAMDAFGNALGSSLAESSSSTPATQGVGPWSDRDYVNGMDLQSDAATMRRQTQPEVDAVLGAFSSPTALGPAETDLVAAAGDYNLGRTRRNGASAMGATPVHDEPGGGFNGQGLAVDPAKLPSFWTSSTFKSRYAPSLGWKELGEYLNPLPRLEGFTEGFSFSGMVEGAVKLFTDPEGAARGMQERTRSYFEAGRRGDWDAAARFEGQLAGEQTAGLVLGYGVSRGLGLGARGFNAVGGVASDLVSSALSPYSSGLRLGSNGLGLGEAAAARQAFLAERYGSPGQRDVLLNQIGEASTFSEAKGVVYAFREMKRLGFQLEDISLKYRGNQGLDLTFSKGSQYAIVEAKHGKYLSSLDTYAGGLRQGSVDYNISRLERYLQYGDGKNAAFANRLLTDAYSGKLDSFATFYRGRSIYELPLGWPKVPGLKR